MLKFIKRKNILQRLENNEMENHNVNKYNLEESTTDFGMGRECGMMSTLNGHSIRRYGGRLGRV